MDECILWRNKPNKINGYGYLKVNGQSLLAHRFVFINAFGPIPEGMDVLHKCDTPNCVNLDHLFLGSHEDNMEDMKNKGRAKTLRGEEAAQTKLTTQDVLSIRGLNLMHRGLSHKFKVSKATISAIKTRRNWHWLPDQLTRRI